MGENKYFRSPSDSELEMDKYFNQAGDLDEYNKSSVKVDTYFRPASDLDDINKTNNFKENISIEEYLSMIVSGKKYPYESEMGIVVGAANTVVNFEELKRMVDEGYNIVSADLINSNMIVVEFQQFSKDNNIGRGR